MNPNPSADWKIRLVAQAYQILLTPYPAGFRAQYGQEMKDLFQARCLEIYQTSGGY